MTYALMGLSRYELLPLFYWYNIETNICDSLCMEELGVNNDNNNNHHHHNNVQIYIVPCTGLGSAIHYQLTVLCLAANSK
jgi:hypothetical protein